jgi:MraZ protein
MFRGEFHNLLDDKSRLSIPSKFRDLLAQAHEPGPLVISVGLDQCLWLYPNDTWKRNEEQLSRLSVLDADAREFVRAFLGLSIECEVDKQGRIVVPQVLRDAACLDRNVVLVGVLNRIEVWDREKWKAAQASSVQNLARLSQKLADKGHLPELTL